MKKYIVMIPLVLLLLTLPAVQAAAEPDIWQLAVKYSTIEFVGHQADHQRIKRGSYGALESYLKIAPGTYLGGEIGGTSISNGSIVRLGGAWWEADFEFFSLELNLKYAIPLVSLLDVEGGFGAALVDAGDVPRYLTTSGSTESYFGGQVFTAINLAGAHWYGGVNAKYQAVENGYSNWRGGIHLGYRFD
jgi:hypothetical protein